ncbi:hypothetical protein E1B28_009499 [Marasmius oreades]|uniref:Uncharacterized protein n=1 Tax=Marasmius oreades TaxID=181124 RepID=A0A9P7UQT1_9AGAR|nr:uncharacterized protein E1B28_009499 [Marasmius oreades]KAG7090380.1 hypothetical protein E1B28_009499 [Marasmius oreades]
MDGEQIADGASYEDIQDSLHSEWCKACANAYQPREELELVEEEMRRSIDYCYHLSDWWQRQIGHREGLSLFLQEGLTAYAKEHAHVERSHGCHWAQSWHPICDWAKTILSYLSDARRDSVARMAPLEVEVEMDKQVEDLDNED